MEKFILCKSVITVDYINGKRDFSYYYVVEKSMINQAFCGQKFKEFETYKEAQEAANSLNTNEKETVEAILSFYEELLNNTKTTYDRLVEVNAYYNGVMLPDGGII